MIKMTPDREVWRVLVNTVFDLVGIEAEAKRLTCSNGAEFGTCLRRRKKNKKARLCETCTFVHHLTEARKLLFPAR